MREPFCEARAQQKLAQQKVTTTQLALETLKNSAATLQQITHSRRINKHYQTAIDALEMELGACRAELVKWKALSELTPKVKLYVIPRFQSTRTK